MSEAESIIVGPQEELTPPQIVEALDRYIVGQDRAKRAVAVAVRNRWRRKQLPGALRDEVTPKNIIMIGPTGVGKTEIARRLASLVNAPFIKVEASKYTEVGYHGRDVESMVRDLVKISVNMTEAAEMERVRNDARAKASERLLDFLLPAPSFHVAATEGAGEGDAQVDLHERTREKLRRKLEAGELDSRDVDIDVATSAEPIAHVFSSVGGEEIGLELQEAMESMLPKRTKSRRTTVSEARRILEQQSAEELIDRDRVVSTALERAQNSGIIFIDELDKIVGTGDEAVGPEVSRSGVQRDLLPIVEGSSVATRYGMVKTDHILFVAAGDFHKTAPADLIPEMQGRFPMATEGVGVEFEDEAIRYIAKVAYSVNQQCGNIGARRLHTVMEKLIEEISFKATELAGQKIIIDWITVESKLEGIMKDQEQSRTIL